MAKFPISPIFHLVTVSGELNKPLSIPKSLAKAKSSVRLGTLYQLYKSITLSVFPLHPLHLPGVKYSVSMTVDGVNTFLQILPSKRLIESLLDYCYSYGILVRRSQLSKHGPLPVHAAVTIFPSLFPRNVWEEALKIQTTYNLLYVRVANDHEWMASVMER